MSAAEANALVASDYAGGAQAAAHAKPSEVSTSNAKVRPDVALPQRQARHLAS
jgi:hypothetical protein